MLTANRYGCVINNETGERTCNKGEDIRSAIDKEAPKSKPGIPSKPIGPPIHPPVHPPHIPPAKPPGPATGDNRGIGGGYLRDSGVTNIANRAAKNSIKGAHPGGAAASEKYICHIWVESTRLLKVMPDRRVQQLV